MMPLTPFANPSATSVFDVNLTKAFSATVKVLDKPPVSVFFLSLQADFNLTCIPIFCNVRTFDNVFMCC